MSERVEQNTDEPLSAEQIELAWKSVDAQTLDRLCDSFEGLDDTAAGCITASAYMLTAVFATHPHLFGDFVQLMKEFESRYEKLIQKFAASFPEAWANRGDDTVFVISPAIGEALPTAELVVD